MATINDFNELYFCVVGVWRVYNGYENGSGPTPSHSELMTFVKQKLEGAKPEGEEESKSVQTRQMQETIEKLIIDNKTLAEYAMKFAQDADEYKKLATRQQNDLNEYARQVRVFTDRKNAEIESLVEEIRKLKEKYETNI